jgi:hypothetical protein
VRIINLIVHLLAIPLTPEPLIPSQSFI